MDDRPLGIQLVCGFFGLVGAVLTPYSLVLVSRLPETTSPPNGPALVGLFLCLFTFSFGFLALYVAVALWKARPVGRLGGLLWIALWLILEVLFRLWALTGPEVIREGDVNGDGSVIPLLLGGLVFAYLWSVGSAYVDSSTADPRSPTASEGW